jgi:hypothetical protein
MNMKIETGGKVEVSQEEKAAMPGLQEEKAAMPGLNVKVARQEAAAAATQPSAIATQPPAATPPSDLSNDAQAAVNHAKNVKRALDPILELVAHVPDAADCLVRKAA